ncbi:hypothetical protein ACGH2B_14025 [Streptomyces sp. BBFR2]|uniref:hypothetical protein n=1 Tax=Streptomyces sp. BBFR2 TaxID=3372854 RepID=UPI0037D9DCE0
MDIESLMARISSTGASALIKCDGERVAHGSAPWTFVATGGPLAESGPVRYDGETLQECLTTALTLLKKRGKEWLWVDEYSNE